MKPADRGLAHLARRLWRLARFRRAAIRSRLTWPLLVPAAWLWRRLWLRGTPVIAVTGSFGKTSTTTAVAAVVAARFDADTPNYGSFLAAALLRHRPRRRSLVCEVGISRPGQMRGYARLLRPDVVVLTAIGADHHGSFGSVAAIAAEKAILAAAVRPGGLLVVNGDDPRCLEIAAGVASGAPASGGTRRRPERPVRVVRAGFAADCDCRIAEARLDWPAGTRLRLDGPAAGGGITADLRWLGRDLARCAALAAAVGVAAGVDHAMIGARLGTLAPVAGRLEPVALPGGAWLLDDAWKGTAATVRSALGLLAEVRGWRRIAVLDDIEEPLQPRASEVRDVARRAAGAADRILFLGSDVQMFAAEVRRAGAAAPPVERCRDVHAAATLLQTELLPRTLILVKGRHSRKLGRLVPLLRGQAVACTLRDCPARGLRCGLCPRLTAG